jgi:hypothetical protein
MNPSIESLGTRVGSLTAAQIRHLSLDPDELVSFNGAANLHDIARINGLKVALSSAGDRRAPHRVQ